MQWNVLYSTWNGRKNRLFFMQMKMHIVLCCVVVALVQASIIAERALVLTGVLIGDRTASL